MTVHTANPHARRSRLAADSRFPGLASVAGYFPSTEKASRTFPGVPPAVG